MVCMHVQSTSCMYASCRTWHVHADACRDRLLSNLLRRLEEARQAAFGAFDGELEHEVGILQVLGLAVDDLTDDAHELYESQDG